MVNSKIVNCTMEISEKIQTLRRELDRHNYNYYVLSAPTISDFEFDKL